jgi:hypothetical protein
VCVCVCVCVHDDFVCALALLLYCYEFQHIARLRNIIMGEWVGGWVGR